MTMVVKQNSCYNNYCYCKLINMADTFVNNPSFFKLDATLKKLRNYWQKMFDSRQMDITVDQWLLVENLYKHKKTTHNELARNTSKDITTISRIIEPALGARPPPPLHSLRATMSPCSLRDR